MADAEEVSAVWEKSKLSADKMGTNAAHEKGKLLAVIGEATAACKGGNEGGLLAVAGKATAASKLP